MRKFAGMVFGIIAASSIAFGQSATVDHLSQSQLLDKAKELEAAAESGGSSSVKLAEYPNHFTMVALRKKSGGAEMHQHFADFFFVIRGEATLVTGGSVANPKNVKPGEIQGAAVKDGVQTVLHEGDVVHIPSGVPHQLLLTNGGEFLYFVIKVRES